jgi:hypothetical protein
MGLIPELAVDNGRVLSWVGDALVRGFANVNPVVEELIEHSLIEQVAVAVGGARRDQLPASSVADFSWTNLLKIDRTRTASASRMMSLRSRTS